MGDMIIAADQTLPANRFTVPEAAWAAEIEDRVVNQEVDRVLEMDALPRRRILATHDVLYLSLFREVTAFGPLAVEARRRLYLTIRNAEDAKVTSVTITPHVCIRLTALRRALSLRTDQIMAARSAVEMVPGVRGGAPVVRGTRVPVSALAAMQADGASLDELSAEFDLDRAHVRLALLYNQLHPRLGRPAAAARGKAPSIEPDVQIVDVEDLGTLP